MGMALPREMADVVSYFSPTSHADLVRPIVFEQFVLWTDNWFS